MGKFKWIGGLVGWAALGPTGALLGLLLGSLTEESFSSMKKLSGDDASAASAYTILGISPSATDDEIKAAYRRMAMKVHPDKVAALDPEVQKAAEARFRKIHEAYETIRKQRGI